jgi:hypothetical protein
MSPKSMVAFMRSMTVLLLILCGCSTIPYHPAKNPDRLLRRYGVDKPKSPYYFTTCSRPGCSEVSVIRFTRSEWQQVADLFLPPYAHAGEERQAIAKAVGLMERLLRWHRVAYPARRGLWNLHNTAVVEQMENGELFAVDSWFRANGEDAVIVPMDKWLGGYEPERGSGAVAERGGS